MKTKNKISAYIIRSGVFAALLSCVIVGFSSALNLPDKWSGLSRLLVLHGGMTTQTGPTEMLTFADRVAYQRAIEEVYWRHRIWPRENAGPKPPLDSVTSQAQIETKVKDYLHNSQALEDYWHRPISSGELQSEMDRMAQHTKRPEVLSELFEALGSDPFIIAECLARPLLAERIVTNLDARDRDRSGPSVRAENWIASQTTARLSHYQLPEIGVGCVDGTWTATSTTNAPNGRTVHTAVWTGSEMIVWGGFDGNDAVDTGGRYDPATDSWTATSTTNAPEERYSHTAVWTGGEMIVWGGNDYFSGTFFNTGGKYNPSSNSWTSTSITNAPDGRTAHTAVWTGTEVIVWGGQDKSGNLDTGGRYDPATDSWTATSTTNVPNARYFHTAVWTGAEMIVWGGNDLSGNFFNTGGRYNPSNDSWTSTSITNAPTARADHTAVLANSEMIVWGGSDDTNFFNSGGRYDPVTDSWTVTTALDAPEARNSHTAVWTGSQMIVWGGSDATNFFNSGGQYNPSTDSWAATSLTNAPEARIYHTAIGANNEMIVWGGRDQSLNRFNTGGRYCVEESIPTPTPTPCTGRCSPTPRPRPTPALRPTP